MSALDIFLLDNSNNIIEEINVKKPKTYQGLVNLIKKKLKKLPNHFNIFYQSPNNKNIIINSNKEYNLSINILFVKEIKENKLQLNNSINSDNSFNYDILSQDLIDELYSCFICSELIKHENPLFCYSCQKIFHQQCLKNWDNKRRAINENLNCPNCRKELPFEQWQKIKGYEEKRKTDATILNRLSHYEKDINEDKEIIKE